MEQRCKLEAIASVNLGKISVHTSKQKHVPDMGNSVAAFVI